MAIKKDTLDDLPACQIALKRVPIFALKVSPLNGWRQASRNHPGGADDVDGPADPFQGLIRAVDSRPRAGDHIR